MDPIIKIAPSSDKDDSFWLLFEPESHFHSPSNKKVILGEKTGQQCRFCNRDSTTTFKMKAHVIPEFMGNKVLMSNFECDECNSIFSKYETALSDYGGIMNTLSLLKGKKGVPKFKSKNEKLRVKFNSNENQLNVKAMAMNVPLGTARKDWAQYVKDFKISEDNKTITFKTNKPTYIPRHVLNALVKIGFSFLHPTNLFKFEKTRKWLINEINDNSIDNHPLFHIYKRHGKFLRSPVVILARKKN